MFTLIVNSTIHRPLLVLYSVVIFTMFNSSYSLRLRRF